MFSLTQETQWNDDIIINACADTCTPDNPGYIEYIIDPKA